MKKLIEDPEKFYTPKDRPSGHDIARFGKDNGGSIPSNLLQYANSESNSLHIRHCKTFALEPHPRRVSTQLPAFFINFLTDPDDTVLDIFGGSNTTGATAEELGRKWISIDCERDYAIGSAFRFMEGWSDQKVQEFFDAAKAGRNGIKLAVKESQKSFANF